MFGEDEFWGERAELFQAEEGEGRRGPLPNLLQKKEGIAVFFAGFVF